MSYDPTNHRVLPCPACSGTGRRWLPDREVGDGDNDVECTLCFGSGNHGISNPFAIVYGRTPVLADELASAVDNGHDYVLEAWLLVSARIPHTARLRAAFGPFVTAHGRLDRIGLLREMAREYLKVGEDCARIDARKGAA